MRANASTGAKRRRCVGSASRSHFDDDRQLRAFVERLLLRQSAYKFGRQRKR
jgi:hypothetical protein